MNCVAGLTSFPRQKPLHRFLSLRWHWKLHAWNLKINNFSSRHQTRIDLAVSLLRKSDAPITNIALEVSYNNYPYFTSAFKSTMDARLPSTGRTAAKRKSNNRFNDIAPPT